MNTTKLGYLTIAMIFLSIFSCKNEGLGSLSNKPTAMGKINQVVILADKELSESPIGDTLLSYFASAYPVLPAEEAIFDVRFMTPKDLVAQPYKKELRTYILVADLLDTASATTKMLMTDLGQERYKKALQDPSYNTSVGVDKWAKNQILIYIFGAGHEAIAQAIRQNFSSIAKRINKHDEPNLHATVYGIQEENQALSFEVFQKFGLHIKIPGLYVKALEKDNFLWVRMDTKEVNQSLIFRKFKYVDKEQFSKDNILKMRNEYGKDFNPTSSDNAYMSTNVIDLPIYDFTYTLNGIYTHEIRGIWETENDFMGGPFVTYVLYNEAKAEIVFIDAFVYAPGKEKRDYIQQLDAIVKTSSFPKPGLN